MEVVTIEKKTFSYVCERFTEFAKRIESLCSTHTQKVENWLDSQEVYLLLGFSKRTLQYYRSSGRLAYSQIGIIISLLMLKELLRIVKHKINHPNKSRLMKRTKEDIFSLLYMYRKPPNRLHPLLMKYRKKTVCIL